jgi:hypothetical protein
MADGFLFIFQISETKFGRAAKCGGISAQKDLVLDAIYALAKKVSGPISALLALTAK